MSCLVTGAAGGIGHALVQGFRDVGYRVIATDQLPQPADLCCAAYFEIELLRLVSDQSYGQVVARVIRQTLDGNRIDAHIHNAAVHILGGADSLSRDDWRRTLDVNVLAPFLLA